MEMADAVVSHWSVHLLEIAPELTDADVAKLQDDHEVLGPIKSICPRVTVLPWMIYAPCPWRA